MLAFFLLSQRVRTYRTGTLAFFLLGVSVRLHRGSLKERVVLVDLIFVSSNWILFGGHPLKLERYRED